MRQVIENPDSLIDAVAFRREQTRLAHVWTFLGLAQDIRNDGDWFRATLGTRSVFVQRFKTQLRGFDNRCAHRSYPLRDADRGNGPIVCGFHHWRYDQDGRAVGIPMCKELFGVTPRELDAHLDPVEISTCGAFIFGRFTAEGRNETLQDFLGEGFSILEAMSDSSAQPQYLARTVKANWRLCYHTSVEDYHIVAVHPKTFGKSGYLKRENIGYFRFGLHNAYFTTNDPDALSKMSEECRAGTWRSINYRVFHIFPNLVVSHFRADGQHWFILVLQYAPRSPDHSVMRAWIYPAPFAPSAGKHQGWIDRFTNPLRSAIVRYFVNRVLMEDNQVGERLQMMAPQMRRPFILGALEERIAWFEASYAEIVRDERAYVRDWPVR